MIDNNRERIRLVPSYRQKNKKRLIILIFFIGFVLIGWSAWRWYYHKYLDLDASRGTFSGSISSSSKRKQLEQLTLMTFPKDATGTFRASWDGFLDWSFWAKVEGSETMIRTALQNNGFPQLQLLYQDEIDCASCDLIAEDFWPQESWWQAAELQDKEYSCKMQGVGMHLTFVVCGRTSDDDYVMYVTRNE